jgi:hypothetical protein
MKKKVYKSTALIVKCNRDSSKICDNCNKCILEDAGIEKDYATNKKF